MHFVVIDNLLLGFIIYGVVFELVILAFVFLFYRKSEEMVFVKNIISGIIGKRKVEPKEKVDDHK